MQAFSNAVYALVRRIPAGRVATYGLVARLVGNPRAARQVGYVLAALASDADVPWHRVVNAQGKISPRVAGGSDELQRILLEDEGIVFDEQGRIDLDRYCWPGLEPSAHRG